MALREVTSCTPVNSYQTLRFYIPDNSDPHSHRHPNLEAREGMVRTTTHSQQHSLFSRTNYETKHLISAIILITQTHDSI
jgi:hypothetical protein